MQNHASIDLSKLVWDILTACDVELPPDPEACKECKYHTSHLSFDGESEQHCYMFKKIPDTLCMQFKKAQ